MSSVNAFLIRGYFKLYNDVGTDHVIFLLLKCNIAEKRNVMLNTGYKKNYFLLCSTDKTRNRQLIGGAKYEIIFSCNVLTGKIVRGKFANPRSVFCSVAVKDTDRRFRQRTSIVAVNIKSLIYELSVPRNCVSAEDAPYNASSP